MRRGEEMSEAKLIVMEASEGELKTENRRGGYE